MNTAVITGMGAVTPLGPDVPSTWEKLCAGVSGLRPITVFDTSGLRNGEGGEVEGFEDHPDRPRSLQFLLKAVAEAVHQSGLDRHPAILAGTAIVVGTNFGCSGRFAAYRKYRTTEGTCDRSALGASRFDTYPAAVRESCGAGGPGTVVSTACASSLAAIDAGLMLLDEYPAVICAGVDELTLYTYAGLNALRAITKDRIRPFTAGRGGTQFGEGAGAVILERETNVSHREVKPLARIAGAFMNNDAFHTTAPDQEGNGITAVMKEVFRQSGVAPVQVGHLSAHGTGTKYNDAIETLAVKKVFGPHAAGLCINAIKSMTAHGMGAAGMIELIAAVNTLRTGIVPPTVGLDNPDPDLDLNYCPNTAVSCPTAFALSNSYGIGGANGSVLLSGDGQCG